ncbi:MAG: hypothetical protein ACFFCO_02630 [Promethearchaeota archaeon]
MERRTFVAILIISACVLVDVAWAWLNYIVPAYFEPVDIVVLLPGGALTDWLILMYLFPLASVFLYLLLSSVTAQWLVLPLNKIFNPGKEIFFYAPETPHPRPVYSLLRRAFFNLLLMMALALTITRFLPTQISWFLPANPNLADIFNEINQAIILMPLIFPLLAFILPATWLIEDSNVVFHTYPSCGPQELRVGGRTLLDYLKGFASIFVLIDYLRMVFNVPGLITLSTTPSTIGLWPWVPVWFFFLITFINPFILLYLPLAALLLYHRFFHRIQPGFLAAMQRRGTLQLLSVGEVVKS